MRSKKSGLWKLTILLLALASLLAVGQIVPALAHQAPSGWKYPDECCSESHDCQMIHARNVSVDANGYIVTLEPGEHRHAPNGGTFYLLDNQVKKSGDDDYHVCIHRYRTGPGALCIYIPPQESSFRW